MFHLNQIHQAMRFRKVTEKCKVWCPLFPRSSAARMVSQASRLHLRSRHLH